MNVDQVVKMIRHFGSLVADGDMTDKEFVAAVLALLDATA